MKNSLAGVAGYRSLGRSKRSNRGRFAWVPALILVVGVCLLMTTSPKTASDPVLPAQAGQAPVGQGTMVSGQVNGFSGSYSTSVPIDVIPGRNGLQPALSLSYTSSVAYGSAGTGWGVPVSSIQRMGPGRGTPTYGYEDRFFMSMNGTGVELMPLGPASIQGGDGFREFRTRLESWSRVIAHYLLTQDSGTGVWVLSEQVASWEVWSKSGERYYFGPLTDAETDACSLAFFVDASPRRNQWMLRLVEDVDGNSMEYAYSQGTSSPGSLLLTKIQYGGNRILSGYSHFASVNFVWEARPDKRFGYANGIKQATGDRLARIEVRFNDEVKKSYWLHYGQSPWTDQSRLESVTVDSPTASYPKIKFEYSDAQGYQPVVWAQTGSVYADYPGRGIVTNFSKNNSSGSEFAGTRSEGGFFMDMNGDGLPDKLDSYASYDAGTGASETPPPKIYLNRGPEQQPWEEVSEAHLSVPGAPAAFYYVSQEYQHAMLDTGVRFADITGDGIPEKIDGLLRGDGYPGWPRAVYKGRRDGSGWDPVALGAITQLAEGLLPDGGCASQPRYLQYPLPVGRTTGEQLVWGIAPRTTTAGGRLSFIWKVNPAKGSGFSYSIQTKLDGLETQYTAGQPLFDDRFATYLGTRCFENLPPGSYTYRVKLSWTKAAASQGPDHAPPQASLPAPNPQYEEITYPFTVTQNADAIPPQVLFTQTPPEGFIEEAAFAWQGADTEGPVTYATWMAPKMAAAPGGTSATQATYPLSDLGVGGSFFVAAYDAAGNMNIAEWAYDGGQIKPPIQVVWNSGPNNTIQVASQGTQFVDVNGDGYADILSAYQLCQATTWTCNSTVGLVSLFNPNTYQWERAPGWSEGIEPLLGIYSKSEIEPAQALDTGVRLMDVNGDGLPDFIRSFLDETANKWTRWVRYNKGRGWGHQELQQGTLAILPGVELAHSVWQEGNSISDRGGWLLDLNGDGLLDKIDGWKSFDTTLACPSTGQNLSVYLNRGTSFAASPLTPFTIPQMSFSEAFRPKAKDQSGLILSRDTGVRILDMNGDGLPDFLRDAYYSSWGGILPCDTQVKDLRLGVANTTRGADGTILSPKPDYLVKITNPIGGVTEIKYKAAVNSYDRISPDTNPLGDFAPGVPYVVESVSQQDGRGANYKTKYIYAHPKLDIEERQSVGFREVTVIAPDGTSTKTTYHQDFPFVGSVEKSEAFAALDANGTSGGALFQISTSEYESESDAFGVWRVRKIKDRTKVWEKGTSLETGVDYGPFDEYDNVLVVTTLGDVTKNDDDKQVQVQYINKKDEANRRWLLGFIQQSDTYALSPGGGPVFASSKRIFYDDLLQGALTKGHPTREDNWLDVRTNGGVRQPYENYLTNARIHYKDDGTLDWRTDSADIKTTFDVYDSTRRFPLKKTVHGQHGGAYESTATADVWGRPLTTTDAKGVMTSVAYDSFGRPTEESIQYPMGGSFTTKRYYYHDDLIGSPTQQFVEVVTFLPGTSLSGKAYYDGLGRSYRNESEGWQKRIIQSEVYYDAFGRTKQKSQPHFAGETHQLATVYYDLRGRANREEGFGSVSITDPIEPLTVETSVTGTAGDGPPITHKKRTTADAYGRLVWVKHDNMPAMKYEYDVMGALTSAWGESQGGGWQKFVELTYDSWGHKLSYQDYDAGVPTTLTEYFYDTAGRLIKQHESLSGDAAIWRETTLVYGGDLYQLTSRVGIDNTGAPPLTEALEYWVGGGLNNGELKTRTDASGTYEFLGGYDPSRQNLWAQTTATLTGAIQPFVFREYKDTAGRTVTSELPSGETVNWSYYADSGMPWKISDQAGTVLAEYRDYDETRLIEWQRGNGVKTTYTHDQLTNRLTNVASTKTVLDQVEIRQSLAYTFYTDGQVATVTDASSDAYNQSFTYDSAMRLQSASSPAKYGTLNFSYDDSVPGGRLEYKDSYSKGTDSFPNNAIVQLIYDEAFAHRVTSTSDGRAFVYDAWGNVVQETKPGGIETLLYTYDSWNRMTGVSVKTMTSPGDPRGGVPPVYETRALADHTYDASGERVQTVKYAGGFAGLPIFRFQHVSALGYEVEEMPDSTVKTRWAIPGPHGLVCWKQKITSGAQFYAQVGQTGHSALAGMAWERLWADSGNLFAGGLQSRLTAARGVVQNLAMLARHAYGAAAANPNTPGNIALGGSLLLGLALVALPSTRRGRKLIERLLNAEAKRRRAFGRRLPLAPLRPEGWFPTPQALFSVLPFLSLTPFHLSFASSRPIRLQSAAGLPQGRLRAESSSPSRTVADSPVRPFAPWSPLPFRFAARLFIFLFVVQAGMFVAPVQVRAETLVCEETFYPLTDHLGSVNILTGKTGEVVLSQHFLPFGEDFENPKSTVTSCNGDEPWPYGFTGQHHDDETGLIYMHARYYNPATGHFMSADTVVPNPQDTFAFDRYAYVRNNPINLTDPTGHGWWGAVVGAVVGAAWAMMNDQNVIKGAIIGAISGAMMEETGGLGGWQLFWANMGIGALTGALSAALYGGDILRGAIIGAAGSAVGAGMSQGAGKIFGTLGKFGQGVLAVMAGGVVGGLSSVAMGGKFWEGFTQGGFAAGLSFVANGVAGEIKLQHQLRSQFSASLRSLAGDANGSGEVQVTAPPVEATQSESLNWPEGDIDPSLKSYLIGIFDQEQAEVASLVAVNPKDPNEWFLAWQTDDSVNSATKSFGALRTMGTALVTRGWEVTHLLHVHPGYSWWPTRIKDRLMFNFKTMKLEPLDVRKLWDHYPTGASPGDLSSYTEAARIYTIIGAHPSLGIIDSSRRYIAYGY